MREIHTRFNPVRQLSDAMSIKYIPPSDGIVHNKFDDLSTALQQNNCNEYIFILLIKQGKGMISFKA